MERTLQLDAGSSTFLMHEYTLVHSKVHLQSFKTFYYTLTYVKSKGATSPKAKWNKDAPEK